jgi:hypothetical protein
MINLTELLDRAKKKALEKPDTKDGYAPKSTDELRFKKKHVVQKTDDRNGNKDDVFKATNVKTLERAKERHGYNPDEDEKVYEGYRRDNTSYLRSDPDYKPSTLTPGLTPHKSQGMSPERRAATEREMARIKKRYAAKNEEAQEQSSEDKKVDRLAAIAAAAKKKNAQIGKTIVTGSKGGVGGAETRRYPAGTLKNSHEPEGEQIDERNKLNKMLKNLHARKVGATRMQNHGSPELNRIAALKKGRELMKNSHEPEGEELDEARKKSPTEKLFNRLKNYGVKDASAKPLVGNQHKIDANKNGKIDAEDFKLLRKEEVQVDEVLNPSMGAGAYISDFVHSKNPKFAGKSKKERMKQALAAYYSAKRGD